MLPHRSLQKAEAASNLFQGSATIKQVPKPRRLGLEREGAGRGLGPQQARWEPSDHAAAARMIRFIGSRLYPMGVDNAEGHL